MPCYVIGFFSSIDQPQQRRAGYCSFSLLLRLVVVLVFCSISIVTPAAASCFPSLFVSPTYYTPPVSRCRLRREKVPSPKQQKVTSPNIMPLPRITNPSISSTRICAAIMSTKTFSWNPLPPRGESSNRERHRRQRRLLQLRQGQDTNSVQSSSGYNSGIKKVEQNSIVPPSPPSQQQHQGGKLNDGNSNNNNRNNKRRPNRPGFNSYLKVLLDDSTMDRLHQMALMVQNQLQEQHQKQEKQPQSNNDTESSRETNSDECDNNKQTTTGRCATFATPTSGTTNAATLMSQSTSKQKQQKSLRFKPRSRASLYMTLFFGGETLCELPHDELHEWYQHVKSRLIYSGFTNNNYPIGNDGRGEGSNDSETMDEKNENENFVSKISSSNRGGEASGSNEDGIVVTEQEDNDPFSFRVVGLRVFPPQRNNLVVALLEPSPAWHDLYRDLRHIGRDESISPHLAELIRGNNNKEQWISHITLGNLMGTKGQIRDALLSSSTSSSSSSSSPTTITTNSPLATSTTGITDVSNSNSLPTHNLLDSIFINAVPSSSSGQQPEQQHPQVTTGWFQARTRGISMGGPIPQQIPLDWDFEYNLRNM